jgi:hypothetical protein
VQSKRIVWIVLQWVEVVIALRILLFTLPVWISKFTSEGFGGLRIGERFLFLLTIAALCHFLAGLSALLKLKISQLLHFVSLGVVIFLTAGFTKLVSVTGAMFYSSYVLPACVSLLFVFSLTILHKQSVERV